MTDDTPKNFWISGPKNGQGKRPARLLELIAAKKSIVALSNRSEVGVAMTKNVNLLDVVEALHDCVSAGLFRRDEAEMDCEKKMSRTIWKKPSARG